MKVCVALCVLHDLYLVVRVLHVCRNQGQNGDLQTVPVLGPRNPDTVGMNLRGCGHTALRPGGLCYQGSGSYQKEIEMS